MSKIVVNCSLWAVIQEARQLSGIKQEVLGSKPRQYSLFPLVRHWSSLPGSSGRNESRWSSRVAYLKAYTRFLSSQVNHQPTIIIPIKIRLSHRIRKLEALWEGVIACDEILSHQRLLKCIPLFQWLSIFYFYLQMHW